jgi:UDP-N-acetylglucosamine--N-acetylmuramyl-(pentapeptide) pyrophosphoryl-undecaprenol N-acetylglucosamine transferase
LNSGLYLHYSLQSSSLSSGIFEPVDKISLPIPSRRPIVYITGGTTGAQKVNEVVFSVLPQLLKTYTVVHQTGDLSLERAGQVVQNLPDTSVPHYIYQSYFLPGDVGWLLKHSAFALSRSGANSVTELMATGCPAILVPLPWSGGNEQLHNAKKVEKAGMGVILSQQSLTAETLLKCIEDFSVHLPEYKLQAQKAKVAVSFTGTRLVLGQIERILS